MIKLLIIFFLYIMMSALTVRILKIKNTGERMFAFFFWHVMLLIAIVSTLYCWIAGDLDK